MVDGARSSRRAIERMLSPFAVANPISSRSRKDNRELAGAFSVGLTPPASITQFATVDRGTPTAAAAAAAEPRARNSIQNRRLISRGYPGRPGPAIEHL
jgi:hypothetical protein